MEDFNIEDYRARAAVSLSAISSRSKTEYSEEQLEEWLDKVRSKLAKIQDKLYAHNRYGVLICLQGMDTSGKDSLIREVFKEMNARGTVVHSFKTPNSTELEHDYLWRHYIALPEKGKFAIFNRTHYENVLVTHVHPEYILNENLPGIEQVGDITESFWENRFEDINNFERHITRNGIIVLKFYLNLSKEEQRQRLLRRLEEEKHNWKFSPGDLKERARWDDYMRCYDEVLSRTSTDYAPWFVIPADDKPMARFLVGKIILDSLREYEIENPPLEQKIKDGIDEYRRQLESE